MSRPAAIFDVDRTLLPRASLESLFIRHLIRSGQVTWRDLFRSLAFLATHAGRIPPARLLKENKAYLRGRPAAPFYALCREWVEKIVIGDIPKEARLAVEARRNEGCWIILLTGTLDALAVPLGEHLGADVVLATRLAVEEGILTGSYLPPHPYGEGKWAVLSPVVAERGIDLASSHVYADCPADLAILQGVGHPHVVSPGRRMRKIAAARGWDVRDW